MLAAAGGRGDEPVRNGLPGEAGRRLRLRWFTPKVEVDLCGHATLASAHVLWQEGHVPAGEEIHSTPAAASSRPSRKESWIELDFPLMPGTESSQPPGLIEALGTSAKYVGPSVRLSGRSGYGRHLRAWLRTSACCPAWVRGLIVTSRSSPPFDFVSRFFAPRCRHRRRPGDWLGPLLPGTVLAGALRKDNFTAFQASAQEESSMSVSAETGPPRTGKQSRYYVANLS